MEKFTAIYKESDWSLPINTFFFDNEKLHNYLWVLMSQCSNFFYQKKQKHWNVHAYLWHWHNETKAVARHCHKKMCFVTKKNNNNIFFFFSSCIFIQIDAIYKQVLEICTFASCVQKLNTIKNKYIFAADARTSLGRSALFGVALAHVVQDLRDGARWLHVTQGHAG